MPNIKSLKEVHNDFCDYEVDKAKASRIRTVRIPQRKQSGIRTANLSRAILAQQLALLFNVNN